MHIYIIYMPCICNNYVYYVQTACCMHLYASDIQKYAWHMHLYAKYALICRQKCACCMQKNANVHIVCRHYETYAWRLYADIYKYMPCICKYMLYIHAMICTNIPYTKYTNLCRHLHFLYCKYMQFMCTDPNLILVEPDVSVLTSFVKWNKALDWFAGPPTISERS